MARIINETTRRIAIEKFIKIMPLIYVSESNCWVWPKCKDKNGYGKVSIKRVGFLAHRISWSIANKKDLTSDVHICHACDNPSCINPDHLWAGSARENIYDAIKKGRPFGPKVLSKCKRGHLLCDPNLFYRKRGDKIVRECKTCNLLYTKSRRNNLK